MKIPIRTAQNKQRGHQFDMLDLRNKTNQKEFLDKIKVNEFYFELWRIFPYLVLVNSTNMSTSVGLVSERLLAEGAESNCDELL